VPIRAARNPLSSAILYLAIVAIWAGVLVPRWVRSHAHRTAETEADDDAGQEEPLAENGRAARQTSAERGPAPRQAAHEGRVQEDAGRQPPAMAAPVYPPPSGRPARVLRARRRMLATLILLTAGAGALAAAHVAAAWVIVPPAVMLTGFLLLLRAAARIDAERAAHRTYAGPDAGLGAGLVTRPAGTRATASSRDAAPAPQRHPAPSESPAVGSCPGPAWQEAEPGWVTAAAPDWTPNAEIIDISGRMRDQVYDQYSDAAERAVGD
jgi:hypothetical protein